MADFNYVSEASVRKRAHNVNQAFYDNSEITEIIQNHSQDLHQKLGRLRADAFVESDEQYESVKLYVLNAAACEIIGSLEIQDDGKCKEARDDALESLTTEAGDSTFVTTHFDLIDGIDEDVYGQKF